MENIKNAMKKATQVNREVKAIKTIGRVAINNVETTVISIANTQFNMKNSTMTLRGKLYLENVLFGEVLNYYAKEGATHISSEAMERIEEACEFLVRSGQFTKDDEVTLDLVLECTNDLEIENGIVLETEY